MFASVRRSPAAAIRSPAPLRSALAGGCSSAPHSFSHFCFPFLFVSKEATEYGNGKVGNMVKAVATPLLLLASFTALLLCFASPDTAPSTTTTTTVKEVSGALCADHHRLVDPELLDATTVPSTTTTTNEDEATIPSTTTTTNEDEAT
eukprot:242509_1